MDDQQVGEYGEGNAEVWASLSRLGYNASRDEITMPASERTGWERRVMRWRRYSRPR